MTPRCAVPRRGPPAGRLPGRARRQASLAAACFFACLAPAAVAGLDQTAYFCRDTEKPFFTPAAAGGGEYVVQRPLGLPDRFFMPKPPGVIRVFVVGESVANILGRGKFALREGVETVALDPRTAQRGGYGLEILNCGMGGYESSRIFRVLKEILGYSPDLVVVLSGNHEGLEEQCRGFGYELRRRKARLLEKYYSFRHGRSGARKEASLKMHYDTLVKMARSAGLAGVPVVFCTLPVNVKDLPFIEPLPLENKFLALGTRLFYQKKYERALAALKSGLAAAPGDSFLSLYLARTLVKLGKNEEAKPLFLNSADHYGSYPRADRERNAVIRAAAGAERACVADLEKLFYRISPGGLPGFTEFADDVHWNRPYNKAVWEEIFRSAESCGIRGFSGYKPGSALARAESPAKNARKRLSYAFSWLQEDALNEGVLAQLAWLKKEAPEILKRTSASPEALGDELLSNQWSAEKILRAASFFPFYLAHLAENERRAGNCGAAMALIERSLAMKPGNPYLRLERAQVLADSGRGESARKEFFELGDGSAVSRRAESLGLSYGVLPAASRLGVPRAPGAPENPVRNAPDTLRSARGLLRRLYAPALSMKTWFARRVRENGARRSGRLSDAAVSKMRGGDMAAAEAMLLEAVRLEPSAPEALMNLCTLYLKKDEKARALEACRNAVRAVGSNPKNRTPGFAALASEAAFTSYKLLEELGRGVEAKEMLRQAVVNAPASWPDLVAARKALKDKGLK